MRKVVAFLVWLFSFWTWKEFFLRWLGSPSAPRPGSTGTAAGDCPPAHEKQPESEFTRFLSSLPEKDRLCRGLTFDGDAEVELDFESGRTYEFLGGADVQAGYAEVLEAAASSKLVFSDDVSFDLSGTECCEHVEALAEILRHSGHHFRRLDFECDSGSAIRSAKCVSSVILGQGAIQSLLFDFAIFKEDLGKDAVAELVSNIHTLPLLKSFQMEARHLDGEAMEQLLKPFQGPHSILEHFQFHNVSSDMQLEQISYMLATSTSLKKLSLDLDPGEGERAFLRGYNCVAVALCSNQSLECLECEIYNSADLKALLDPLIPQGGRLQGNTTLTELHLLDSSVGGKEGMETLVALLCKNSSLLKLTLLNLRELGSNGERERIANVLAILKALKSNKSLTTISFEDCGAVEGYEVLGAMMDMLSENHCIQDIDLTDTGLEDSGDAEYVYLALAKRQKMKLWGVIRGMANVKPTSGRVFLCGPSNAGKTTMRMSMKQLPEFQPKAQVQKSSNMRRFPGALKGFKATNIPKQDLPLERTHGIEVDNVQCHGIGISIWDMAGQPDYLSFYELVMPNLSSDGSSSLFLLMCDPMERLDPMEQPKPFQARSFRTIHEELESWLRFLASNTRRSLSYRPHVSIVMTHYDHWKDDVTLTKCIEEVVMELKSQFKEIFEFDEDKVAFMVDGTQELHAREVFDFIQSHLKQLLKRLPQTIGACQEVQQHMAKWNSNKSNPRLLTWEEFCENMCKDVEELKDANHELAQRRKEFVAISLNDGGHIIYMEKEGVVITDPHWFCHSIVGEFLHQCVGKGRELEVVSPNGLMSKRHVRQSILQLLEKVGDVEKKFEDILSMMTKLHMCYDHDVAHIMIPSTLKDKHEVLNWSQQDGQSSFTYVGRKLACKDGKKTMLTSTFFTRLQVSFFKELPSKNVQDTYQLFQDVIKFVTDGIEVILHYYGGDIDILLRSDQSQDKMHHLLDDFVVYHIKQLQEDATLGCPGVLLEEYILRPACVQCLVHPRVRKNQCVGMRDLELEVALSGIDARYNWKPCEGLDVGWDKVKSLLGDLAWRNLLERRSNHLRDYEKCIQGLDTVTNAGPSNGDERKAGSPLTSLRDMPSKLWYPHMDGKFEDLQKVLGEIQVETMTKMDQLRQAIQSLEGSIRKIERDLLPQVCSRMDDLMKFSVEMQKSQLPRLTYMCEVGKRKLLTRLVPGLKIVQLHLMCESVHGFHEVPHQKGCQVTFGSQDTRRFVAMILVGLRIFTILAKVGAHVDVGMDAMVRDFSDSARLAALVFDTPGLLDGRIPDVVWKSLPRDTGEVCTMLRDDFIAEAEAWMESFLASQCQNGGDFYKNFLLKKVRYNRSSGTIAWICNQCIRGHGHEIDVLK